MSRVQSTSSDANGVENHELYLRDAEEHPTLDRDASNMSQGQRDSLRTRACVIAGSAIIQLPIWGFAMSYGVFQEYFSENWTLKGSQSGTGVVGTTQNGVLYLSMPFLFALFTKRWARRRQLAAVCGVVLTCLSFLLSSFSTTVWHLIATQGVMAAMGCALIYSPVTLSLGEWFNSSNRALAYGIVFSAKNIVGSTCPFLFRGLLDHYGFRTTLRIWTCAVAVCGLLAFFLIPTHPSSLDSNTRRTTKIPWKFLRHQTFYIYAIATMLQSAGYGIPQTYLNTYAHEVTLVSQTSATLLLTLFNVPGIVSSSLFGYLSDAKRFSLSTTSVTAISGISSALSAWLLWGLTSEGNMALLCLFSITFGFFASGYSATWGGSTLR